jgi:hypothetical protein
MSLPPQYHFALGTCISSATEIPRMVLFFATASRLTLGPTELPAQRVPWYLTLWGIAAGREADHSSPASADVKNAWNVT